MWKILIADDEPKIRQGLKDTLENFGLPVEVCAEARNGLEALEKTKELEPDILLVDIMYAKTQRDKISGGIAKAEDRVQDHCHIRI